MFLWFSSTCNVQIGDEVKRKVKDYNLSSAPSNVPYATTQNEES